MEDHQLSELVPLPEHGRIFTSTARVRLADVSPSGRMRLDALARWIQDVSYDDMADAGVAGMAMWVIRRMRIRVARFPRFAESFRLQTFCSGLGRMWAERRVSITSADSSEAAVESATLWVHLDPGGQRPVPLLEPELDTFSGSTGGRRVTARLRHPHPRGADDTRSWHFRQTERDVLGHVNNSAYLEPLEEELLGDGPEPERFDVEIEFRTAAQPGETTVLQSGSRRWVVSGEDTHASIVFAR